MTPHVQLTRRWFSLVAIIVLLTTFFSSAAPQPAQAQAPTQTQAETTPVEATTTSYNAEVREDTAPAQDSTEPAVDAPAVETDAAAESADQADIVEPHLSTQAVQGTVAISVSVQPEVRHSQYITYAFSYKNNGTAATTSLFLETVWTDFRHEEDWNASQYCPPLTPGVTGCGFITASAFGPTITRVGNIPGGVRYSIGNLSPGQSGGFKVQLLVGKQTFSTSLPGGSPLRRPAGSGLLYVNGETKASSELTASSLIVGPVLRITKTLNPNLILYPLETAPFTLTVGNATGSGDTTNGTLRADARPATNVIVREFLPPGVQLVSAEGNYTLKDGILTWVIPVLNPRESKNFKMVFKKLDGVECGKMRNESFDVTSNELPLRENGTRYLIGGDAVTYGVITPLTIKSLTTSPNQVVYGGETTITVVVQSFWEQPMTGASLQLKLPANAMYLTGTANPAAASEPPANQYGTTVNWVFNMPAATRTVAAEKTFSVRVRTGYFDIVNQAEAGVLTVKPPTGSNVPNACAPAPAFGLEMLARLTISMGSDAPESTRYAPNSYYVKRGQTFPYIVSLVNNSSQPLVVDKVWVNLPWQVGANFTYVVGSSKVNGVTQAPNTIVNGFEGRLEWNNIAVAANSQTIIRYSLTVQGLDYVNYCNEADGYMAKEKIKRESQYLCVKINPQVELKKSANKQKAGPGEEVIFEISLTNRESVPYMLGLADQLSEFEWVGQISGYDTPIYDAARGRLLWPVVSVAPNQTISAKFRVRMMGTGSSCTPGNKPNEVIFQNETSLIGQDPPVMVVVELTCRQIVFSQGAERTPVSLGDKFMYAFEVANSDSTAATSTVAVTDVLPLGFTFVGIDPTSPTIFTPTQTVDASSGRIQLNWTLEPIPPSGSRLMKFFVRSGKSIGSYENWMSAAATGGINRCVGMCEPRTYKNVSSTYSITQLQVQPLITIEPSISPATCVLPGASVNYKLTVLNTNVHSYPRTTVVLTVPLGLSYVEPVGTTPIPAARTTADGATVLSWGVSIPKKPDNAFGSQVVLEVTLKVGNIWGTLNTELDATSTSGLIPRKDGVVDTTVKICPQQPSLAKIGIQKVAKVGDEVVYQISVANPNNTPVTATVEDVLPSNTSFVRMLTGNAPTQSGNKLTWNLSIPAATNSSGSVVILRFATKVNSGTVFQKYTNTATITQSSATFVTVVNGASINNASFTISKPIFVPMVRR